MDSIQFTNEKVLIRVDFNVPLDKDHQITDDTRIRAALPTIQKVISQGGSVILMSHLGRPKISKNGQADVDKFTLKHVVPHLSKLLGIEVQFSPQTVGAKANAMAANLKPGEVLIVENTRFEEGETTGDNGLAEAMSKLGTFYINDAFGTAHRAHASTAVVAQYFPAGKKAFGYLMNAEITNATKVLNNPERPFTAILGGAKVSDKIQLIDKLLEVCDNILIGGGMGYTFSKAMGGKIGNSICEDDYIDLALKLLDKAKAKGVAIHLPLDLKIADKFSNDANTQFVNKGEIPDEWEGLDIGPKTIESFSEVVLKSKTIIWNGPQGVFEFEKFADGTNAIAQAVAKATQENNAFSLIGGGDSVSAINKSGLADQVSFISTGGGAMLEFLEGKQLPGIKAIKG